MAQAQAAARRSVGVRVTLEPAVIARLDDEAKCAGVSRSGLIRRILEGWVDDGIDETDLALAEIARQRLADPDDEVIPWEQAKADLGL